MLWFLVKWYALLRGVWKGITYKAPPMSIKLIDSIIRQYYIPALREELNKPSILLWGGLPLHTDERVQRDEVWIAP